VAKLDLQHNRNKSSIIPTKIGAKDLSKSVLNFEQTKTIPNTLKERPKSNLKDINKRNSGIELTKE